MLGTIWPYMTKEYILFEMSYADLKAVSGLVPKEKLDYCMEERISIEEQKKNFGFLGNIKRG
jgi:hypothetical protein